MTKPAAIAPDEHKVVEFSPKAELPPVPAPRPNPSKLRLAVLLVIAVYPVITGLLYILMPLTEGWATWHRTLLIAPIMVFSIVFGISPMIGRHLGWFIARMPRPVKKAA